MASAGTAEVHVKVVGLDEALEKVRAACADVADRRAEIAAVFDLWHQRLDECQSVEWRLEPGQSYSDACADYFLELLAEVREATS